MPTVGIAKESQKLSFWKVTPPEGGLWSDTSVNVITFNEEGQISGDYIYLDEGTASTYSVEPGWYTNESVVNWDPQSANDVLIPFGSGVQVVSDCGAEVTFFGEVSKDEISIKINGSGEGGYTWTGNCSPVNLTLKDFAVTPPEGGLWSDTSVNVITFNEEGQILGDYIYLDEGTASTYSVDPGWYTNESVVNWAPESAGDVSIEAGEMFQIVSDCGATITVPSALPVAE